MSDGVSALFGGMAIAMKWKLWIITIREVLMKKLEVLMPPVHPGEVLREDFMNPLGLTVNKLALEVCFRQTCVTKPAAAGGGFTRPYPWPGGAARVRVSG